MISNLEEVILYYRHSIEALRIAILKHNPTAIPDESAIDRDLPSYLLWMLARISEMDRQSLKEAIKAGRWLGWVLRAVESDLKLWKNDLSRDLVRQDVAEGNDMPQQKTGL